MHSFLVRHLQSGDSYKTYNMQMNFILAPILLQWPKHMQWWVTIVVQGLQIREARKKTWAECLRTEYRLTINAIKGTVSNDFYEVQFILTSKKKFVFGKQMRCPFALWNHVSFSSMLFFKLQGIRAIVVDKDNRPKVHSTMTIIFQI